MDRRYQEVASTVATTTPHNSPTNRNKSKSKAQLDIRSRLDGASPFYPAAIIVTYLLLFSIGFRHPIILYIP
ncbi:hypothetical protein OnM2_033044 [Erysiphe neolycopersici]|uniref:Uncharacterized protein n=1 Tax=Erysiphe neolycopersici TaxID=212602 RepID=A0A420HY39_9PEZI|nr:hypothetical protein OnM2_033044 [Erysiphe neolycopersici]